MGTPIAWLFGQPIRGAINGFQLTGGLFNYTSEIQFPDTGHSATIKLEFQVKNSQKLLNNLNKVLLGFGCF